MSSLSNVPKTKGKKANLGSTLQGYGIVLGLSASISFAVFDYLEDRHRSQIEDYSKAPKAVITQTADKNPLAKNANQPASLNRSGGDTSQGPSTDAETHLAAAEEAIRAKKNFFSKAKTFSFVLLLLGYKLMWLSVEFFRINQQEGRKE
jgi:hypothetical protein